MANPPVRSKRRSRLGAILALVLLALGTGAYGVSLQTWTRPALPPRDGPAISDARTWGYQLQRLDLARLPDHVDLLVTDYSRDGSAGAAFTPGDVEIMKQRQGGRRRIVLSYLSIGEAESYRYYWRPTWRVAAPAWLGDENPEWKGNYPVRFWMKDWQQVILRTTATRYDWLAEQILPWHKAYLDRIIDAGFDGIYLDRIDVFSEHQSHHRRARADMIAFVSSIAAYARSRRAGFLVVAQNAEELLTDRRYLSTIDAIAKEDLQFGAHKERTPNPVEEVREAMLNLDRARTAGKPVLVVEYVDDTEQQVLALVTARQKGYVPLIARRALDQTPEPVLELPPATAPALPPAR